MSKKRPSAAHHDDGEEGEADLAMMLRQFNALRRQKREKQAQLEDDLCKEAMGRMDGTIRGAASRLAQRRMEAAQSLNEALAAQRSEFVSIQKRLRDSSSEANHHLAGMRKKAKTDTGALAAEAEAFQGRVQAIRAKQRSELDRLRADVRGDLARLARELQAMDRQAGGQRQKVVAAMRSAFQSLAEE
eukprot:EG_transcript_23229